MMRQRSTLQCDSADDATLSDTNIVNNKKITEESENGWPYS